MNFLRATVIFLFLAASSLAQVCKPNQYDMLKWMSPQMPSSTFNGHYNVLYPTSGTFYWIKSPNGFPWDVDTFDDKYVYQWITEYDWNDPTTYKIFQKPLPWMPRCVDIPQAPGKLTTITLAPEDSTYDLHTSCSSFTTKQLSYVVNELWGPSNMSFGGTPAKPTLTLVYRYACDKDYSKCTYKEEFYLQEDMGLVQWKYYALDSNGAYAQQNMSVHATTLVPGTVEPVHPCW